MKRIIGIASILGTIIMWSSGCDGIVYLGKQDKAVGEGCSSPSDCASGDCGPQNVCLPAPSCSDNMLNGTETDVDCGGKACNPCPDGKKCLIIDDCQSRHCVNQNGMVTCQPVPMDMVGIVADMAGNNTDSSSNPDMVMVSNDMANSPADMASQSDMVAVPNCMDNMKNGMESDVDCGGNACPKCIDGKNCGGAGDCVSNVCTNGKCVPAPTCNDMIKNGSETDVDCGGNVCSKCNAGKMCGQNSDCTSNMCANGVCCGSADMLMTPADMVSNSPDMGGTLRLYVHASAAAQMACGNQLIIVTWGPLGKEYRSVAGQPLDILIDQSWGGYVRTNTICNGAYKDWSGVANQTPVTDYDVYQINGQNETKTWVCPLNGNGPKLPQTNMDGSNPC